MSRRRCAISKNLSGDGEISPAAKERRDSYRGDVSDRDETEADPILSLRGLRKEIWIDEEADHYVKRLREGWR